MPAHPPEDGKPEERKSVSGTRYVLRALDEMPPLQQRVFFWIGATLAGLVLLRFLVNDIIRAHGHDTAWEIAAEVGGSIALLIFAIGFMVPPFGMWMITHIPLPKFLSRGDSK